MSDILGDLDAVGIGRCIQRGDFNAVEAVEAAVSRLRAVEPQLHATVCERFELAQAEASNPPADSAGSLLRGVPSIIKDNTALAGLPTRHGSRATAAQAAHTDDEFTRQFRATGLIPLAKSTLPEFGLTATTESTTGPATANPWNLSHSCGGSSGGSAALVAAGVVPIAHANDGGGSIRIPAACCGLVGLKPTRDRLPTADIAEKIPLNILAEGVVTRTVRDTAAFFAEMEKFNPATGLPAIGNVQGMGSERLRIAVSTEHPLKGNCDPEVVAAVERVAKTCEALGHHVETISSPINPSMAGDFFLYWARLAAAANYMGRFAFGGDFDRSKLEPLTVQLSRHYLRNMWRSPGAIKRLRKFQADYCQGFDSHDLILSPVLATPPVPLGYLALDLDFNTALERLYHYAPFTPAQNVSGSPAISLPLGQSTDGLPIGVQFAAGMGQERRLLEIAFELEQALPWGFPAASPSEPS